MKLPGKADEIAANRFQLIASLLSEQLDSAQAAETKKQICEKSGLSDRTIRRYLASYRAEGFEGLKPKPKSLKLKSNLRSSLLEEAILLRREAPHRSVRQIIQILEWEGKAKPGEIKRSTLQDKLTERGYSSRQMRLYQSTSGTIRRFQKSHRNHLWQSDIKFGPFLPIGINGTDRQVYLVLFIDDATRYILHGAFYPTLDQRIVEDSFRQAVQKFGKPEAVFFDNGKQYRTKWMARTCSKLGTRLLYAKPYSPEAKGKVERVNRVIDSFLSEVALEKPKSLDQLNQLFDAWLSECYQNKPHSSLGEKVTPEMAYRIDKRPLHFLDPETIRLAFLHAESRKVDKSGCISFQNKLFEVGLNFIGTNVDVVYDPADLSQLTIEKTGYASWQAKPLEIGERVEKRPQLPETLQPQPTDSSRLLHAATQKNKERNELQKPAVSYRRVMEEGEKNV